MIIAYDGSKKPEYLDANLDVWLDTALDGNAPSGCVWFVPGTDIEAHYHQD